MLLAELVAEIESGGPIPFERYMDLCLYHPRYGYYTRGIGGGGGRDYLTSSGTHRAFGVLIARQAEGMWRRLGCPARFTFAEFGPGEGFFALDFLGEAARQRSFARSLEYLLVERSPVLRERQQERLAGRREIPVSWIREEDLDRHRRDLVGCLFANEVLDAFPVHRVIGTPGGPREVHVAARDGRLVEVLLPLSSRDIDRFMEAAGLELEDGQEVDLSIEAPRWAARVVGLLDRGYAVMVDYGYEARELYDPARRRGTLLAYHRHRFGEEFYRLPGDQDLTAHVDFTAIERAAGSIGGRRIGLVTQAGFLLALGALDFLPPLPDETGDGAVLARVLQQREALKDLFLPGRMGERFRVLVLARGEVPDDLSGLRAPWERVVATARQPGAGPPGFSGEAPL